MRIIANVAKPLDSLWRSPRWTFGDLNLAIQRIHTRKIYIWQSFVAVRAILINSHRFHRFLHVIEFGSQWSYGISFCTTNFQFRYSIHSLYITDIFHKNTFALITNFFLHNLCHIIHFLGCETRAKKKLQKRNFSIRKFLHGKWLYISGEREKRWQSTVKMFGLRFRPNSALFQH